MARRLEETYHATRDAFAAGAVNQDQVAVIVRSADLLPVDVSDAQRRAAEAGLVAEAVAGANAKRLRQAVGGCSRWSPGSWPTRTKRGC
ncbi:13E12 repeat family protein [Nocardioides panacis]|uniref:13E12 repeat family protein n=1 Tax=Nocardioides panacis TaxID=2849501 RepID=A0A975XZB9_9ACTN|nr:13E12 repeat family protein [Nocardioides panacis]